MRAIVFEQFGSPDVLEAREVPLPIPGPGQVRVAVHAAGTNPVDAGNRLDGSWAGIQPPVIPGAEASGVVDALGPDVAQVGPGEEVFYLADFLRQRRGTYAEYHVVDAELLVPKPPGLSHVEAAALPLAAGTAYELIIRRLAVTAGEWVLLYGAAGGVGSAALQLAVAEGARVIAVARAEHHALLTELGALACLDYTSQEVVREAQTIAGGPVDAVADCVGGATLAHSLSALRPFGRAATIASVQGNPEQWDLLVDLNLTLHGILVRPDRQRLAALSALVARGTLRPIIAQVLPLELAAQAHRRLETRHGQGKIVLQVRSTSG
jgi:NADPH2:quinone reductase